MRNAPFTLSAMLMLAVFLCLGVSEANAQCSFKYCLEDATCNGTWQSPCATPNGDCASYAFTAPCSGTYELTAQSVCQYNCHDCEVCVTVVKVPTGVVVGSCNTVCSDQDCSTSCSVSLQQGVGYFLYVCKTPCDFDGCETCTGTHCRAFGCLCYGVGTPCTP
jgi:hypothetical protein